MMLLSLLLLILVTSRTEGIYECCPKENLLSLTTKRCSTNDSISLTCNGDMFPVSTASGFETFNYLLMDNGTLIDQISNLEIRYCQSYPDDDTSHPDDDTSYPDDDTVNSSSHIYIICFEPQENFEDNKYKLVAILGYISVAFTILTIIVYAMVPKLLDLQGICILHSLIGLAAGYTVLGVIQLATYLEGSTCTAMAFLMYFSYLYLFFWLNTLSFHIWRTAVNPRFSSRTTKWATVYHIFAIGGSLIFLIFLLLAHYSTSEMLDGIRPGIGDHSCWFKSMRETMIFFYGPIAGLLFFNVIFYFWTIIVLWRQEENTPNKILKYRLKLCMRLFVIMGITWTFEIITAALRNPNMSIFGKVMIFLLDLLNILQGLFIFLVLVVFRKKVRRALASKNVCNIQFPNSWKYLEDEEMESIEEKINNTVAEYKENDVEIKR